MRIAYLLLSPTWGMHQYTAGYANAMARRGHEVHLVTTRQAPLDRYAPAVTVHTPVDTHDTGFSPRGVLQAPSVLRASCRAAEVCRLVADVTHVTGPHLVNPLLLPSLQPNVHSLHDLHPHQGAAYGRLLYLWNGAVRRRADHVLVHGARWRAELLAGGLPPERVTCTLLTHLFVGHEIEQALLASPPEVAHEPWALLIGRLEAYKGLEVLVEAARKVPTLGVVIAGPGRFERLVRGPLADNVTVHNRLVGDKEAVDLFRRCGLVVLPYVEASQSALVAAAYAFCKPVVVSDAGALPEYVVEGETGWVAPAGDAGALAQTLAGALGDTGRLAAMGRAGRAWYERQRAAEVEAVEGMYGRLAGRL